MKSTINSGVLMHNDEMNAPVFSMRVDQLEKQKEIYELTRLFYPNIGYEPPYILDVHVRDCRLDFDGETYTWKESRGAMARLLYGLLSKKTGHTPPWGILTGVRPLKLWHQCERRGLNSYQIEDLLRTERLVSEEKINKLKTIAQVQKEAYTPDLERYSIYIHIPFCPSRCHYCTFVTRPLDRYEDQREDYVEALLNELRTLSPVLAPEYLRSIYIGGGTPTSLSPSQLQYLLEEIRRLWPVDPEEFTLEAGRIDSLNAEKLALASKYGVTRICVNPQTIHRQTLGAVNRHHATDFEAAVKEVRRHGISVVNMDFICGLPGEGPEQWLQSLYSVRTLRPENITVHALSYKKGSYLTEHQNLIARGEDFTSEIDRFMNEMGYHPYYLYRQKNIIGNSENVGYCLPEKASVYNIIMMEESETVVGFGVSATSKHVGQTLEQYRNPRDFDLYIQKSIHWGEEKKRWLERSCHGKSNGSAAVF